MFITFPSTIHQINMIAVTIFLLLSLSITPLIHGKEILSTVVVGGQEEDNSNKVTELLSRTIPEDVANTAAGVGSFVGNGYDTTSAGGSNDDYAIASGSHNAASDSIQRKLDNDDSGDLAFIGLGTNNVASEAKTVIGGGEANIASATYASILGGIENLASGYTSTVGGGNANVASGDLSTISGGDTNIASLYASTVGGGYLNAAAGEGSTVSGGYVNVASGVASTVGGGYENTASGYISFVGGGSGNTANGDHSIALGKNAKAETDQSCVINLLPEKVASSKKVGEFLVSSNSFHVRSSKSFTIRIGSKKVTIDKNNIKNFKNLLKGPGRRLKQIDEQKEIIKEQQEQIEEQQEQIEEQQEQIDAQEAINNEQQEQIDELHRMLINFAGRSTE